MHIPFTREDRQGILDRYILAYRRWQDLDYQVATAGGSPAGNLVRERDELDRKVMDLRDQYRAGLPFLPISRCPFTGMVVYHSLDPYGIDGLWWNYDVPERPVENLPVTVHSITGALRISGTVRPAPFLCMPGPGAPYVFPGILSAETIRAVIMSVPVGDDTGYVVTYFSSGTSRVPRANTWGMNHWETMDRNGTVSWGEETVGLCQPDFDLAPWIERKKLLWITPGDRAFSIREGTGGCPYPGIDGPRQFQRVKSGKVQLAAMQEK